MKSGKQQIQDDLKKLRRELDALDEKKIPPRELKQRYAELNRRRTELENQLLETILGADSGGLPEVWRGLRHGMLAACRDMEKVLRRSIKKEARENRTEAGRASRWLELLREKPAAAWPAAIVLVYLLLLAVSCLGSGFQAAFGGADGAARLFQFATNPFTGLLVGMLATALIQSSSTTTSIIVALCAAGMPVTTAIPMVMGANIGTSVTNTLVSLGAIGSKRTFRRAFAAATVHDFFNLLAVVIFLPLEIQFHLLERLSGLFTGLLYGTGGPDLSRANLLKPLINPVDSGLHTLFRHLPGPRLIGETLFIVFGLFLIFFAILVLGKLLRGLLTGRAEKIFKHAVGRSPLTAIGSGLAITVLVQSSSTTTSLIVPLAGAGVMTLGQVYPFTLGANIGTCVTALIAALAITGTGAAAALQIALIHLLFNTLGVTVIFGVKFLRGIPPRCARLLAAAAARRRIVALAYVAGVFFLLPLLGLGIYRLLG